MARWPCAALALLAVCAAAAVPGSKTDVNLNALPTSQSVIQYLNQAIQWYRQLTVEQQLATEPTEVLILNDNRETADQIMRLAFDFARAVANLVSAAPTPARGVAAPDVGLNQSLAQTLAQLDQQAQVTQAELDAERQKLDKASGKKRQLIASTIAELQSELDLINARRDALKAVLDFAAGASTNLSGGDLRAEVEALARSVPPEASKPTGSDQDNGAPSNTTNAPLPVATAKPAPSGIWGLASDLIALSSKRHTLDGIIQQTDQLAAAAKTVRAPLITQLRQLSNQGNQIAQAADNADLANLQQQKKQLDALTAQFKAISASVLPLGKQAVLLNLYKANLQQWKQITATRYRSELISLAIRVGVLIVILLFILGTAELWRKTIFRYVRDGRRRYQLLLIRKILLWIAITVLLIFTLSSQLESVATFAGLITAGVAVALQSVILSIVGYFFLIGRYGISVGDRVQVSGTTGEVIEVGLVRFYMMEYSSDGMVGPTGRVASFSNSIVFQPASGLFKQIPGTSFAWHEVSITLPADSNYAEVEKRLHEAVEKVYAEYRDDMERQARLLERTGSAFAAQTLKPKSRLKLTAAGLEASVRYPVLFSHAAEIDDRVTRLVLQTLDRDPKLNLGGGRPAVKVTSEVA